VHAGAWDIAHAAHERGLLCAGRDIGHIIEDSPVIRMPHRSSCTTRSTKKKSLGNCSTAIAFSGESFANGSILPLRGAWPTRQTLFI